jgi:hypothetical protein
MTDDDDYRAERTMARAVRWNDGHRTANNSSSLNLLSLTTFQLGASVANNRRLHAQ